TRVAANAVDDAAGPDRINDAAGEARVAGAASRGDEAVAEASDGIEREHPVRRLTRRERGKQPDRPAVGAQSEDPIVRQMAIDLARRVLVASWRNDAASLLRHARQRSERPRRPAFGVTGKDRVRRVLDVEELRSRPDDTGERDIRTGEDVEV